MNKTVFMLIFTGVVLSSTICAQCKDDKATKQLFNP